MALALGGGATFGRVKKHCEVCGARLIQYVAQCFTCGTRVRDRDELTRSLAKPSDAVRIGHLTDLHIGGSSASPSPTDVFEWWLEELRQAEVDIVVVSGDLVDRGLDEQSLAAVRTRLDRCGIRWLVVPGNHDVRGPGEPDSFRHLFGSYPRVSTESGVDFILVDSQAGYLHDERGPWDQTMFVKTRTLSACVTDGRVGADQCARAAAQLSHAAVHRVLVLHHHLVAQGGEPLVFRMADAAGWHNMRVVEDAAAVLGWAARHEIGLILHGHKHVMRRAGIARGSIVVLGGGSSTQGPPYVARIVDLLPDKRRTVFDVELRR